jgi:Protein of unknown function (DUF2889)
MSLVREHLHTRTISCKAFARNDDLIDIEGTLLDIKTYPMPLPERGIVPTGEPLHEMKLSITIDRSFLIRDASALTLHSPYRICDSINDSYRQIIGLRIESGFTQNIKRMFRGVNGCQHLTELLPTMATTAFQVMWATKETYSNLDSEADKRATPLDGCHALRRDGDVVRLHFPQHYRV